MNTEQKPSQDLDVIKKTDEFNQAIDKLGSLYEGGKDCLNKLYILHDEMPIKDRLYVILQDMRDIAAIALKATYSNKDG